MSERFRTITAFAVLVAIGFGSNELHNMAGAAAAMACCATTDYSCAGFRAPDTCCQRMQHAAAHPTPSTAAATQTLAGSPAIAVLSATTVVHSVARAVAPVEFKRPHDPPHLHTFSLLI